MRIDRLSTTSLVSTSGVTADIPYGILDQGLVLSSSSAPAVVTVLPVSAVEDPRFGPYVTRNGVYRVEDRSGRIARIGQGRILDRVRRHRANRIVIPCRLICAVPRDGEWSIWERCYLEAVWAAHWRRSGNALASDTFMTTFPSLRASHRGSLEATHNAINELVEAGLRLLDGDEAQEFAPAEGLRTNPSNGRAVGYHRTYPIGTRLIYETDKLVAKAMVRASDVLLLPESIVHLTVGESVGAQFRQEHAAFLLSAGVVAIGGGVGRTIREVAQPTAAALMKRVSGGRVHNSDRWRPYPPVSPTF